MMLIMATVGNRRSLAGRVPAFSGQSRVPAGPVPARTRTPAAPGLAGLPRAAVVVEDSLSQVFKLDRVRPAVVAELQDRWPAMPIVFCETRQLAEQEEWTYRYLAAAHAWATTEAAGTARIGAGPDHTARVG